MKKLNWEKLPRQVAAKSGTVWEPTAAPTARARININAGHLEELFCRQEVVKQKKAAGPGEEQAKPKVVCCFHIG